MTDFYDRAQALEQRQREEALARQFARLDNGASLSHCEDCAEPIPEARQRIVAGCTRCVQCQEDHEQAR
ncbi:TraR/DksA family transcriptional regulator [Chromobacterium sp. IIBBL 290-4]|uniref:TraR/DksA family transcriptional regulator n=1 Tax=Chromobacterium sp. IIBBL 290-4 TaxID=2953890 RepID=UPI0020B85044|nr:TraR/DksA family transcriptional regulator [Chromobacterium sp. IIBBL 290-4]UTH73349.1 TraR/DksA family transcriptional regulator [Chromobacterium sp. IIBBL 290-4]